MKKMYQKGSQQGMAHSTWVAVEGSSEHKDRATTGAMATEARGPRGGQPWSEEAPARGAVAAHGGHGPACSGLGWTPASFDLPASASRFLPRPRVGQTQQEASGQVMPGRSEVPGLGLMLGVSGVPCGG